MAGPSPAQLAQRVVGREREALTQLLNLASQAVAEPVSGTPLHTDIGFIEGHPARDKLRGLFGWTHGSVAEIAWAADEMARALPRLLTDEDLLLLPALSTARSLHEATVVICSLVDARQSTETRLSRFAAQLLRDTQSGPAALRMFPDGPARDEQERLEEARALAYGLIESTGFEVVYSKGTEREARSVTFDSAPPTQVKVNFTDLTKAHLPASSYIYKVNSGASHLNPWMVRGLEGTYHLAVAFVLLPLLDLSDALVDAVVAYSGVGGADELHRRTHQRRVALMKARGDDTPVEGYPTYARRLREEG